VDNRKKNREIDFCVSFFLGNGKTMKLFHCWLWITDFLYPAVYFKGGRVSQTYLHYTVTTANDL